MEKRIISHELKDGTLLEAAFLPEEGMTLASYKKGPIQIIDKKSEPQFEERHAGLGVLIGPHFHRRKASLVPKLPDESLFPHIARCRALAIEDPFSHGVARYAPWKAESGPHWIEAKLSGKDLWNGVPLKEIEGQDFEMRMRAELSDGGLRIDLSVVSDSDSLIGIHYYYALPEGDCHIRSRAQPYCLDKGERKPVPQEWFQADHRLDIPLKEAVDLTFYPYPDPLKGEIELSTPQFRLKTHYACLAAENSWQLYHPKGAPFVCIEPVSAQDPRHPNLTASSLTIHLTIEEPDDQTPADSSRNRTHEGLRASR